MLPIMLGIKPPILNSNYTTVLFFILNVINIINLIFSSIASFLEGICDVQAVHFVQCLVYCHK